MQWTWSTILAAEGGDNAIYLLTAKYFSPFSEYSNVAHFFTQKSQYPPLFPLMLGLLGGGDNLLVAHLITTGFLLIALLIYYFWLLTEKLPPILCCFVVLVFALLPGIYMQALSVHSENLYILLTLLSLLCVALSEQNQEYKWLWGAVLAIGLASLTRSAGITLIVAFVLYVWVNKVPKRVWLTLVCVCPFLLWKIFGGQTGVSYLAYFQNTYSSAPLQTLVNQLNIEMAALWAGWKGIFSSTHTGANFLIVVALISLLGTGKRIIQKKLDGYYVLCYVLLILIWPFPAEAQRFIIVVAPILIYQSVYFVRSLQFNRLKDYQKLALPLLLLSLIAIQLLPDLVFTVKRYYTKLPEGLQAYRHHKEWYKTDLRSANNYIKFYKAIYDDISELTSTVTEDQCIFAIKPSLVGYGANRVSMEPPLENSDSQTFYQQIAKDGCNYFYFGAITSPSFRTIFYPKDRLAKRVEITKVGYLNANKEGIVGILGVLKQTN